MSNEYYRGLLEGKAGVVIPPGDHDQYLRVVHEAFVEQGNFNSVIWNLCTCTKTAPLIKILLTTNNIDTDRLVSWLMLAVSGGEAETVKVLLEDDRVDPNQSTLTVGDVAMVSNNQQDGVGLLIADSRFDAVKWQEWIYHCLRRWPELIVTLTKAKFDFSFGDNRLLLTAMEKDSTLMVDRLMKIPAVYNFSIGSLIDQAGSCLVNDVRNHLSRHTVSPLVLGWALRAAIPNSDGPTIGLLLGSGAKISVDGYGCVVLASKRDRFIALDSLLRHKEIDLKYIGSAKFLDRVAAEGGNVSLIVERLTALNPTSDEPAKIADLKSIETGKVTEPPKSFEPKQIDSTKTIADLLKLRQELVVESILEKYPEDIRREAKSLGGDAIKPFLKWGAYEDVKLSAAYLAGHAAGRFSVVTDLLGNK